MKTKNNIIKILIISVISFFAVAVGMIFTTPTNTASAYENSTIKINETTNYYYKLNFAIKGFDNRVVLSNKDDLYIKADDDFLTGFILETSNAEVIDYVQKYKVSNNLFPALDTHVLSLGVGTWNSTAIIDGIKNKCNYSYIFNSNGNIPSANNFYINYEKDTNKTHYVIVGRVYSSAIESWGKKYGASVQAFTDYEIFSYTPSELINEYLTSIKIDGQHYEHQSVTKAIASALGWNVDGDTTVTVEYKELNDLGNVTTKIDNFTMPKYNAISLQRVKENHNKIIGKTIEDYNVIYKTYNALEDGTLNLLSERIYLEAEKFELEYTTTDDVKLVVKYKPYKYNEFHIRVRSADDEQQYTTDIYTTSVTYNSNGTKTLIFGFPTVYEQLWNSLHWLMSFNEEHFTITNQADGVTTEFVKNNETLSQLKITFTDENELINLDVLCVCNIEEDKEYNVSYTYLMLSTDGTSINERSITETIGTMWYSTTLLYNFYNFMLRYGDIVNAGITAGGNKAFYEPKAVRQVYDKENLTCNLTVIYDKKTVIAVTNNINDDVWYIIPHNITLYYDGEEIVKPEAIPHGYRVDNFICQNGIRIVENGKDDYTKYQFVLTVGNHDGEVIEVQIHYTDNWLISLTYLTPYKETPFAEKKNYRGYIKVVDYENAGDDLSGLTIADVKKILNVESLDLLGVRPLEENGVTVKFDGVATYNVTINYSYKNCKGIDYNGSPFEIKVSLTDYKTWTNSFGQNWSILMLNHPGKIYFKYSDEVKEENLYGFFTVAIFKEQCKNLNSIFAEQTSDGCVCEFQSREVKGSDIYEFFGGVSDFSIGPITAIINGLIGRAGMALCEVINDDNGIYYSYYFYLDGTTDLAFMGRNGAEDYDDTDSATKNAVDKFLDNAKNWFSKTWEKIKDWLLHSTFGKIVLVVLVVIAILLVALIIYKIIKKFKD